MRRALDICANIDNLKPYSSGNVSTALILRCIKSEIDYQLAFIKSN